MSISLYPVKETEPRRWDWVFPATWLNEGEYVDPTGMDDTFIPNPEFRQDLFFNVANRNARLILAALGFELVDDCLLLDINQFIGTATAWLQRNIGRTVPGFDARMDVQSGRCTVIEGGLRDGYLNEQIRRMVHIAQEGKKLGATHISMA